MRNAALLALALIALPCAAAAKPPVLVELYTAQGCGACGDADAFAAKLAERADVLVLTFPVDYWDYLGWSDTFAQPAFADRQKAYVAKLSLREPYTPQVVIDGKVQATGLKPERIEKLVKEAERTRRYPPDMLFLRDGRQVDVGSGHPPAGGADVWLIRYDPRVQEVTVKSGDNRGKTLVQKNVVREMKRLGGWRGRPKAYRIPSASEDGLRTVVVVQAAHGGRILALAEHKS